MTTEVPAAPAAEPQLPAATPANVATPAAEAPPEAPKPDRVFTQAELDEIVEKRLSKERRKREEIKREADVLRKLALDRSERREEEKAPAAKPVTGEPQRDQFPSYEEYIEARADWRADQKIDQKLKERDEQNRKLSAEDQQKKAGEEFRKRVKDTAKDIADFDEVMSDIKADDPVARISADPIAHSDMPARLLYHLATNPEEAERIADLPMGKQAREIWKLEQKLASEKPPVKPSKAPEPIKPLDGAKAKPAADDEPDAAKDPQGWTKWRQRQVHKAKGKAGASA